MSHRALVVDDDEDIRTLLETALRARNFIVHSAQSVEEALGAIKTLALDLVITDVNLGSGNGLELCREVFRSQPDLPVVIIAADATLPVATEALRAGAYDLVTKPLNLDYLERVAERAIEHRRLRAEVRTLRERVAERGPPSTMIGDSAPMRALQELVERVAPTDATVLILGASGTGKELIARAVHAKSRRALGKFVAINCAAIAPGLLESELFGHAKGAFTDAEKPRVGLLVEANEGTILLDEVGEMPLAMQVKLLRALQERTVRPVGANAEVPFNTRVIAATHRDLESDVREKRFREDLYYRLAVVQLRVPPLTQRQGDLTLLAQHFVIRFAQRHKKQVRGLSEGALTALRAHTWPGNVRELENCIESAVSLTRFDHLTIDDLPPRIRRRAEDALLAAESTADLVTLAELSARYIERVLALVGGNRSRAARILGVDRRTLQRRWEHGGSSPPDTDDEEAPKP